MRIFVAHIGNENLLLLTQVMKCQRRLMKRKLRSRLSKSYIDLGARSSPSRQSPYRRQNQEWADQRTPNLEQEAAPKGAELLSLEEPLDEADDNEEEEEVEVGGRE
jgi:hypothetical protein